MTTQRTLQLPKVQLATAGLMLLAASFVVLAPLWAQSGANEPPKPQFNDQGQLIRPEVGYREWIYIGQRANGAAVAILRRKTTVRVGL